MTITAKEFFGGCRRIEQRINGMLSEQQRIRALGCRVTASYEEPSGGSGTSSKVERAAIRLVELERQIDAEIDELVMLRDRAKHIIAQLSDDRYRDILTWRYFDMWSWDTIAKCMHYERMQLWRLHGRALAEAQVYLDRTKQDTQ